MVDHPPPRSSVSSSDRRLAFLRSSYPYLRLEELPSSSEIHLGRALVVDGPLDSRLPLPGETMPVVLSSAAQLRAAERAQTVLIMGTEAFGTLAKVDCRAYGPEGWPRFVVIVQAKGVVTITHRNTDSNGDGLEMYVLPEDHACDPDPITMRLFSESVLPRRTTRDSILSNVHASSLDPRVVKGIMDIAKTVDELRSMIVDGLLSSDMKTLFPTGRRIDDPTLSLHELFACVRSLDGGWSAHTDSGAAEDTARVLHIVKRLREMDNEPQGRQRCVQCGAVGIDLDRRADAPRLSLALRSFSRFSRREGT